MKNHEERVRLTRTEGRDETRMRLIGAAIELYARHGVAGVSLTQIAESAGYSRGAFHSNFSDKDQLQEAVAATVIASLAPQLDAILSSSADSLERLGGYIHCYVRFCADNPEKAQALIAIVGDQAQQHRGSYAARADGSLADLVSLFENGQASGQMRAFDTSIMALALRSTLDAHSLRFTRNADNPEDVMSEHGTSPKRTPEWRRMADQIATAFQLATRKLDHD